MCAELVSHDGHGRLELCFGPERLLLVAAAPDAVRLIHTRRDPHAVSPLLCTGVLSEPVDSTLEETADDWWFDTRALRIRISRANLTLAWHDAAGRLLVREPLRGGRRLEETDVLVNRVGPDTRFRSEPSPDGVKIIAEGLESVMDRRAYRTSLLLELQPDERIFGLGSHEDGCFDYRGHTQELYHHNTKVPVPMILSSRGWGLLVDSASFIQFDDTAAGLRLDCDCEDSMDFWFLLGPAFDHVVERFRALTGAVAPLPKWAFGYVQSRERYTDQAEVLATAHEFRQRGIPLDLIVQDWKTWSGDWWGQKSCDPTRFGDPTGLVRDLHAEHVHLMWSIWPCMRNDGPDQIGFREANLLCADGTTYDAMNPNGRALYWRQVERGLFCHGVDAWWTDCAEPFNADWFGEVAPDRARRTTANVAEFKKYLDPEHINLYPLRHAQGLWEHQLAAAPERRMLNLTRAAFPGSQSYGTVVWSGDVSARWDVLRSQIAEALNYSATGMPWWTCDIGGFFVGNTACCRRWLGQPDHPPLWFWAGDYEDGVRDPGYRELYLRWLQFAAFLPMFRSHGTDTPREPWHFGAPGEEIHDGIVAMIRFRSRLVPYLYSVARGVVEDGRTWLRMLAFDFPDDPIAVAAADQFLCGSALMVCPVTAPMHHGPGGEKLPPQAEGRTVVLPAGCDWWDFWSGERLDGGQTIQASAPLGRLPLYVPAGTILPLGPVRQHVGEDPSAPMEIRIYPGRDGSFRFYDDAGDGFGHTRGEREDWTLRWHDAERELELSPREGSWPGMPAMRILRFVVVNTKSGLGTEAGTSWNSELHWHGEAMRLRLELSSYELALKNGPENIAAS